MSRAVREEPRFYIHTILALSKLASVFYGARIDSSSLPLRPELLAFDDALALTCFFKKFRHELEAFFMSLLLVAFY